VILDLDLLQGLVGSAEAQGWDMGNGIRHGIALERVGN
jgi:hypothetical protein